VRYPGLAFRALEETMLRVLVLAACLFWVGQVARAEGEDGDEITRSLRETFSKASTQINQPVKNWTWFRHSSEQTWALEPSGKWTPYPGSSDYSYPVRFYSMGKLAGIEITITSEFVESVVLYPSPQGLVGHSRHVGDFVIRQTAEGDLVAEGNTTPYYPTKGCYVQASGSGGQFYHRRPVAIADPTKCAESYFMSARD
jgi:hypothetical protein